jgi:hypothetical protein
LNFPGSRTHGFPFSSLTPSSSKHSQKGLLSNIKEIFRYLNPKYAWE